MRRERVLSTLLWVLSIGVCSLLIAILVDIGRRGVGQVSTEFLTAPPRDSGRAGGIGSLLVSTTWIVSIAVAVALPVGLASAVLLAEGTRRNRRFAAFVRGSLDVLNAVPSIVFGLFGSAFFCVTLELGYSILAGGLTLGCMILPILIRTTEQALRAIPREQRLAAAAVELSMTSTLAHVLLPSAAPGIAVGLVLGIGRALSETAALIFTSGYVTRMPDSWLDSGRALSVHIYDLAMNVPGGNPRAYSTALVLMALLFALNAVVRTAARHVSSRHLR